MAAARPAAAPASTTLTYRKGEAVFSQGDRADSVFQLRSGQLKLTVISGQGKGAVIGLLTGGDFFGEACLAGQSRRGSTAVAMTVCVVARYQKADLQRALRDNPGFAEPFLGHVLGRNIRLEQDLADQLCHSSEKRLARMLLLLAGGGKAVEQQAAVARMTQEMLAEIVGTTRARVNFFMNKFRKQGFIDYDSGGLRVHALLRSVLRT